MITAVVSAGVLGILNFATQGANKVVTRNEAPIKVTVVRDVARIFRVGLPGGDPPIGDWAAIDEIGGGAWARRHGGGDAERLSRTIVLTGRRGRTVITNLRARVVERRAPPKTMVAKTALAMVDDYLFVGIDLDSADRDATALGTGEFAALDGQPFFKAKSISLAPGETESLVVWVTTEHCDCTFELVFDTINDGKQRAIAARDFDGQPFVITTDPDAAPHWHTAKCGLELAKGARCLPLP